MLVNVLNTKFDFLFLFSSSWSNVWHCNHWKHNSPDSELECGKWTGGLLLCPAVQRHAAGGQRRKSQQHDIKPCVYELETGSTLLCGGGHQKRISGEQPFNRLQCNLWVTSALWLVSHTVYTLYFILELWWNWILIREYLFPVQFLTLLALSRWSLKLSVPSTSPGHVRRTWTIISTTSVCPLTGPPLWL